MSQLVDFQNIHIQMCLKAKVYDVTGKLVETVANMATNIIVYTDNHKHTQNSKHSYSPAHLALKGSILPL